MVREDRTVHNVWNTDEKEYSTKKSSDGTGTNQELPESTEITAQCLLRAFAKVLTCSIMTKIM
jgi:hypothetical protein